MAHGTRPAITRRQLLGRGAALAAGGIVGAAGAPLLAACGSGSSDKLEVGVLYQAGSPFYGAYQRVAGQVKKKFEDASIKFTFANTEARPKLQLRWKDGNPPDVDYVYNSADRTALHYVTDGQLLDLTPHMDKASWADGKTWSAALLPAFRHFAQHEGKYFSAPDEAVVMGLFYNGKLFDEMNLKPPATWADLVRTCQAIRAKGTSPIAVTGTFQPYMGLWWDHLLLREVGEKAVQDVAWGTAKLAGNPGFLAAANKLAELARARSFLDGFEGTDFTAAQAQFFQGKAAMILMGSWLQGEMKDAIPAGFDLRITTFPAVEGGSGDAKGLFGTLLGESVWSKSKQTDMAVEYLRLTGTKEEQERRVKDLGIVSPYEGIPGPPGVTGMDALFEAAKTGTVTYYYYGISQDKQRSDAWYGPVAKLCFNKISPEAMVSEIDANLARVRG